MDLESGSLALGLTTGTDGLTSGATDLLNGTEGLIIGADNLEYLSLGIGGAMTGGTTGGDKVIFGCKVEVSNGFTTGGGGTTVRVGVEITGGVI